MAISTELQARILRYHHVEKWRANTIARQLGIHHHTVHGVLARSGLVPHGPQTRPSQIDPYLPFILDTLKALAVAAAARFANGKARIFLYPGVSAARRQRIIEMGAIITDIAGTYDD